eukprot:NODE_59_length_28102_cov_0.971110.p23 type:complete len:127 gc:universal NODE_59_length_28102_cov_0.971110:11611-11231(-)
MIDINSAVVSLFWVGLSIFTMYFFDLYHVLQRSFYFYTTQAAFACCAVCIYQGVRVIYIIPRVKKVSQITPENYERYAKHEIESASIAGVLGYVLITIALFNELHILTPLLLVLYFVGFINLLKWF